jgi:hypothetical protein
VDPWLAGVLGRELARSFAGASTFTPAEALVAFGAVFPNNASGIGGANGVQPAGYWHKEVGYPWRVTGFANSATLDGDARDATLVYRRSTLDAQLLGYRVPWSRAIAAVRAILADSTRWITLAARSDDGTYGFVLSTHGGYVPREIHDDETVYKVSRWHPLESG